MTLLRLGVTYGFGASLRRVLAASTSNRLKSFLSGMGITALLQSSTATVLIVSGFTAQGMVKSSAGLGMVLGADVGTTLVAQFFSLNLEFLIPVIMILGYVLFHFKGSGKLKNIGRIFVGAALMLFALGWIREVTEPLKQSALLPEILGVLEKDPFFTVLIAAVLTWLMHSSLATVLLVMSFVATGVLPLGVALYMVLGANLGGTIPPILATLKDHPDSLRVPVGNLLIRLIGVCLAFFFVTDFVPYISMIDPDTTRMVVNFHTAFNLVLALAFLPFTGVISRICTMLIPDRIEKDDLGKARYLGQSDFETPSVALAAAARETLRMADEVQEMLHDTITVFKTNDMALLEHVREKDDILDRLYEQIKTYMARLSQEFLDPKEAQRYVQIFTFATNLEHAGDVIDKNLMPLALKKIKRQISFSDAGMKEIEGIHKMVMESLQLAQAVFVSGDKEMAKVIIADKQTMKDAEINAMATHIERLSDGVPETIATSTLHIDIIRDYRRINSYTSTVAYSILEGKNSTRTQSFMRSNAADAS